MPASFWGELPPPQKKKTYNTLPQETAAKLCAVDLFSAQTMNYKCITENFFEWTIITGNYSSLSSHKGANLCLFLTLSFPVV